MKITTAVKSFIPVAVLCACSSSAFGQFLATGNTQLSVAVGAESAISVTTATTSFTEASGAGIFGAPFTGTTNFSYKVRTKLSGGSGTITVKVTSDFGAGGPSVGSPPIGDAITYTCTAAASGTPCTGSVAASTGSATSVATFGADAHSTAGTGSSDAGSVTWSIPNDPVYKTGTYTATATFTISAS